MPKVDLVRVSAVVVLLLAGCRGGGDAAPDGPTTASTAATSKAAPRTPPPRPSSPSPDTTIESDGKGGYHVKGAGHLKGDAKSCAAFKACCTSRDLSLFCALTESAETQCATALHKVKAYAAEAKVRRPAGCE